MKIVTTDERVAGSALIILGIGAVVAVALLPLWALPAAVWLIATGRTPRSCGHEANRMSGLEAQS